MTVTGYLDLPMPMTGGSHPVGPPGPGKEGKKGEWAKNSSNLRRKIYFTNYDIGIQDNTI